jgi:hypothetical protein
MALAAGAGVLRWTVAAFTTSLGLLACIQPLHGLTFALFHLATVQLIVTVAPVHWRRQRKRSTERYALDWQSRC